MLHHQIILIMSESQTKGVRDKHKMNQIQQVNNELTQQHMMQQKRINDLAILLNEMKKKELSRQENEEKNNTKEQGMNKIMKCLNEQIKLIKEKYNKQSLNELMIKEPQQLIQQNSALNMEINSNDKCIENMIITLKSLNKYMNDIKAHIKQISVPNVKDYKNWSLEQIMLWIMSLDNGKFLDQQQKLKNGFEKSGINVGAVLPELTRSDLSSSPFNIDNFMVKKALVEHFKSLQNQPIAMINNYQNEEGTETAFL
eukprot:28150_1